MNSTNVLSEVQFEIDALDARLNVRQVSGNEELSHPFSFDVHVRAGAFDPDAAIGSSACLTLGHGPSAQRRRGIVTQIEQGGDDAGELRMRLEPLHAPLRLSRRSRLFQGLSVPEILEQYLVRDTGIPVRFALQRDYPIRETVAQYQESDLDFIARLAEHEGISYYYEHGTDSDVLVLTDDTTSMAANSTASGVTADKNGLRVHKLRRQRRQVPQRVVLRDYDERIPHVPLQGEAEIDPQGSGTISEHGAGFRTPAEGAAIARIRAEEHRCRRVEFTGLLAHGAAAPGTVIGATADSGVDEPILLVRLHHEIERDTSGAWQHCREFSGIPANVSWRPRRMTAVPIVHGTMSALAAGHNGHADMDEQGRYRVRLPFEMDPEHGDASGFLRMAQPSAGTDQGMHFPLEPGSEVLWSCMGGDPDRPVITAAVPRAGDAAAIAPEKSVHSFIRTPGGTTLEFGNTVPAADVDLRMDSPGMDGKGPQPALEQRHQTTSGTTTDLASAQAMTEQDGTGADDQVASSKWFKVKVPDFSGTKDCYLRMGKGDTSEAPEKWFFESGAFSAGSGKLITGTSADDVDGTFDYTDGNRVQITQGKREVYIQEKSRITIGGGGLGTWDAGSTFYVNFRKVGDSLNANVGQDGNWGKILSSHPIWRKTTVEHSSSDSYTWGDSESFNAGFSFSGSLSLSTSVGVGGSIGISVATNASLSMGVDVGYSWGIDWKGSAGGSATCSPKVSSSAQVSNTINVKEVPHTASAKGWAAGVVSGLGLVGAAVGGGVCAGVSQSGELDSGVGLGLGIGLGGGLLGVLTARALALYASQNALPPMSEIKLTKTEIKMGMNFNHTPGVWIANNEVSIGFDNSLIIITPGSIDIESPTITINGTAAVDVKAGTTLTLKGTTMAELKGGRTTVQADSSITQDAPMTTNTGNQTTT